MFYGADVPPIMHGCDGREDVTQNTKHPHMRPGVSARCRYSMSAWYVLLPDVMT